MKKLRVLALMHPEFVPPDDVSTLTDQQRFDLKTEFDVVSCLRGMGHDVRPLGVQDELLPIRDAVEEWKPHVVFNLLEEFHGNVLYDHNVVSLLELLRVPYTGCNPRGMILSRGKALAKKLLLYHRIRVPGFVVFPMGRKAKRPRHLQYPLFVKSLTEHASFGISQASLVNDDAELAERVAFVHRRVNTDAIAEQFIEGRELYVGVIGNDRLTALPTRELVFDKAPPDAPLIATAKAKHDLGYQQRHGIDQRRAENLPPQVEASIAHLSKRIYRTLELTGYARLDYRLNSDGLLYFLEANPNPEIAVAEEFASAAKDAGMDYPDLLQKIINIGMRA
jgi:D-alanine-D-alanine ligase